MLVALRLDSQDCSIPMGLGRNYSLSPSLSLSLHHRAMHSVSSLDPITAVDGQVGESRLISENLSILFPPFPLA